MLVRVQLNNSLSVVKEQVNGLSDKYGRIFRYLRLSITDVCNFQCGYCLPFGYCKSKNYDNFLSLKEIECLLNVFCSFGL